MKSFSFAYTVRPIFNPPIYYFIDGKRVSRERYHELESKCHYFSCLYTEQLRNGRYRHGKLGYMN